VEVVFGSKDRASGVVVEALAAWEDSTMPWLAVPCKRRRQQTEAGMQTLEQEL